MALQGTKIGGGGGGTPSVGTSSGSSALKGVSIGGTAPVVQKITPPDTSGLFGKSFEQSAFKLPNLTGIQTTTPSGAPAPVTELTTRLPGDSISAAKPKNIFDTVVSTVRNALTREDPQRDAVVGATHKTIVDKNLYDIGTQLGIDKTIPIDTTKDPSVQDYYHRQEVAKYVRDNYDTIRGNLTEPDAIPDHPEKLGPLYSEIDSKLGDYTKALGIRNQPTKQEVVATGLTLPIVGGLVTAPVATLVGLGAFEAMTQAEHYFLGDTAANKIADAIGANSGTRDVLNLIELFAQGKALHAVYVKAPEVATKFTKQIVEKYTPGATVSFDPAQIHAALSGGESRGQISKQEVELINKAVGSKGQGAWKDAIKNGTTIEVEPEKVVTMVDQAWWAKVKDTLNVFRTKVGMPALPETNIPVSATGGKAAIVPQESKSLLLEAGKKSVAEHADTLLTEVKESIDLHGPEFTHMTLMDKFGFDAGTADKLIRSAQAVQTSALKGVTLNQSLETGTPSNSRVAQSSPGTAVSEPSSETRKAAVGRVGNAESPYSKRYVPPSKETNLSVGADIQSNATILHNSTEPGLGALEEEARKYKNVDEFISNQKGRYHGTSYEIKKLLDDSYSSENIYGQGLYTTDNLNVADGYSRKGDGGKPTIYKIETRKGAKIYDIEKKMTVSEKTRFTKAFGEYGEMVSDASTLREAMDEMRDLSKSGEFSADTAQEYFDSIRIALEEMGYSGLRHTGGGKIGKVAHDVHIYFNPSIDVKVTKFATKKELEDFYTNTGNEKEETKKLTTRDSKTTDDQIAEKTSGVSEPDLRTPKLAERIEETLGETFDDVPQYEGMDMKKQAQQATDLIDTDYERAKRIAMGEEVPTGDLRIGSVFKAVEARAKADGDSETMRALAFSKTARLASSYGQEIKAFDGRDPNSPVDAISGIEAILEKRAQKRLAKGKTVSEVKKNIVAKIKGEIKKTAKKETWNDFVDSITC